MKTAVFAFGRMNPPTIGHGKLVDKVKTVARSNRGTPLIYLSHTHNNDKDPLTYNKKIRHAQSAFGKNVVKKSTSDTVIKVLKEIEKMGYDQVIMVAGSDRVEEFKRLLTKYNGPGKDWNFKKVSVVSAGQRDPDAEGAAGMSATKVRAAAKAKDFNTFKQGVAKGVNVTSLYKDLSEETIMQDLLDDWEPTEEEIDNYINFEENDFDDDELVQMDESIPNNPDVEKESRPLTPAQLKKRKNYFIQQKLKKIQQDMENLIPKDHPAHPSNDPVPKDPGGRAPPFGKDPIDRKWKNYYKGLPPNLMAKSEGLEPFSSSVDERVLTIMQRLQRGRLMRRKAPIMKRMRKVKARRMAPRSRLAYRARKAAIGLLRKRYGGHKGANYANLSISQKIQIDRQIERRKGLIDKISKRMLPKVRKKEVTRLRQVRSGGVKREAVQMDINKEIQQLFEVSYKVEVPGLPTMYVHGKSPAEVKRKLRDTVKPGMIKDIQITRVVDADVKKAFRLKAQGKEKVDDKDSRGAVDEELESFLESVSDSPKYQMKPRGPNAPSWVTGVKPKLVKPKEESAYSDQMDDAHANIYPKRQAMKWKVKPPEGTRHIHPKSKWDGMKKGDIKKSWKDGKIGRFHDNFRPGAELSLEARRGRPPKNPTGDEEQGGEHIVMQLRKSVSLRGEKHVEFGDGAKHQVPADHAAQALNMHSKMKPAQKAHFEKHMSLSHGRFKDAVAGKPLPQKRNPVTGKSDHSWVDHPLGHKWKFDEENTRSIKSFKDVFEAGAIERGKSAIDKMKIPGMFDFQPGGAPADPPKKTKKKPVDRTKEFQDESVDEADEAPVGDHSSDFKTYKYRDPRSGKFYDKQVKRKLEAWKEQTELDEVPILAPVIAGIGRAALGAAGRSIATAAGKTIMPALAAPHIAGKLVGSEDDVEVETEKQRKTRRAQELLAKEMGRSPGQMPDQTSLQNARLESRITEALIRKAVESRVEKEVIYEVYNRGIDEHHSSKKAFDRVNSFINKGKARILDGDLLGEEQ